MLADAENGLVEKIKASALKAKVRVVDTLPDLEGDSLVQKFVTDAPAIYIAPAAELGIQDRIMQVGFGIACVARNAAGQAATRKGDGKVIGMYEMSEFVASLLDGFTAGELPLYVTGISIMSEEKIYQAGLQVAVVKLQGQMMLAPAIDEASLADFLTLNSQFDIEPHAGTAEHAKWSAEPPDHSTSKPELTDDLQVQSS